MTSKEALERISWRYVNEPSFQEWCDIVKQELERLEMLEKANNKIVDEFLELHYYNQKVLKTISILKNRFNLEIKHYANQEGGYIAFIQEYLVDNDLNQQEYELLKEVLEDE